jgi:hypothetical protein
MTYKVTEKGGLIKRGEAQKGMQLGDYIVVRVFADEVTISATDSFLKRPKPEVYKWDGKGYYRDNKYLCTGGVKYIQKISSEWRAPKRHEVFKIGTKIKEVIGKTDTKRLPFTITGSPTKKGDSEVIDYYYPVETGNGARATFEIKYGDSTSVDYKGYDAWYITGSGKSTRLYGVQVQEIETQEEKNVFRYNSLREGNMHNNKYWQKSAKLRKVVDNALSKKGIKLSFDDFKVQQVVTMPGPGEVVTLRGPDGVFIRYYADEGKIRIEEAKARMKNVLTELRELAGVDSRRPGLEERRDDEKAYNLVIKYKNLMNVVEKAVSKVEEEFGEAFRIVRNAEKYGGEPKGVLAAGEVISGKPLYCLKQLQTLVNQAVKSVEEVIGSEKKEGKATFDSAKVAIWTYLEELGWEVKSNLKIPYALSPNKGLKLWFKAQAVYVSQGKSSTFEDARSMHIDIREMNAKEFVKYLKSYGYKHYSDDEE